MTDTHVESTKSATDMAYLLRRNAKWKLQLVPLAL